MKEGEEKVGVSHALQSRQVMGTGLAPERIASGGDDSHTSCQEAVCHVEYSLLCGPTYASIHIFRLVIASHPHRPMRVHFVERDDIYLHRPSGMRFDPSLDRVYSVPGGFGSDSKFSVTWGDMR
jgi:hypothetical protein